MVGIGVERDGCKRTLGKYGKLCWRDADVSGRGPWQSDVRCGRASPRMQMQMDNAFVCLRLVLRSYDSGLRNSFNV